MELEAKSWSPWRGDHLISRILALAVGPWAIPALPPSLSFPNTELQCLVTEDPFSLLFEVLDQWPPRKTWRHQNFLFVGREGQAISSQHSPVAVRTSPTELG